MGFVLAGLVGGLGKGLEADALQKREDALLALKNRQTIEAEDRAEQRDIRKDDRDYAIKSGLLVAAGDLKRRENETEFQYKVRLETLKAKNDVTLTSLKARLDKANTADEISLRNQLDSGTVDDIQVSDDGFIVKVYKDGRLEKSNIKARPTAASEDAEADARREARRNGGAKPKPDEPAATKPTARAQEAATPKATATEVGNLVNQAIGLASKGDPRFKGLTGTQIKAKIEAQLKAQGKL